MQGGGRGYGFSMLRNTESPVFTASQVDRSGTLTGGITANHASNRAKHIIRSVYEPSNNGDMFPMRSGLRSLSQNVLMIG